MTANALEVPALPLGWKWHRDLEGQAFREKRDREGNLTAAYVAWMFDPADAELAKDGNFFAASERKTAKEFVVTPEDITRGDIKNRMQLEALLPDD